MIASEPLPNAFARLDSLNGWRTMGDASGLVFEGEGVQLGAQVRSIPDSEVSGSFGGRTLPRGVAIAPDGRLFLADPQGQCVRVLVPAWGEAERPADASPTWPFRPLWQRPAADAEAAGGDPFALVRPTDVKLACNGDLVIADPGAGRLVVLVMPSGPVRRVIPLEGAPTALGFDGGGRAYVVLAEAGKVVRFDRDWRPDAEYRGGAGMLSAPSAIAVVAGPVCLCRAADPCGCATGKPDLLNGTIFVLDGAQVKALDPTGRPSDAELPETLDPPPISVGHGESLAFHRPPRDALRLPGLAVDRRGRIGGLALVARPRRIVLPKTGSWIAGPFDGARDRFPWDRLKLDSLAPERTRIVVDSYADDAKLDSARIADLPAENWSAPLAIEQGDRPEVLIQSPPGRYLWVRFRFVGDGEATPLLRAVELSGPRASSLRFLPAPFHQDPESASFLDRLLVFFDSMLQEPAENGRRIARYFSPDAVEAGAFLDWLGSWFDWRFLAQWPEAVRREMIREAIPFFRMRGTVPGLRRLLRWHSGAPDPWPTIIEHFRLRSRPAQPPLFIGGFPLNPASAELAHNFTIVMPRASVADVAQLERLIEAQKPAHTIASLRLVESSFRIGRQSSIGVDALIGSAPALPLGRGHLAQGLGTAAGGPPALGAAYLSIPGG